MACKRSSKDTEGRISKNAAAPMPPVIAQNSDSAALALILSPTAAKTTARHAAARFTHRTFIKPPFNTTAFSEWRAESPLRATPSPAEAWMPTATPRRPPAEPPAPPGFTLSETPLDAPTPALALASANTVSLAPGQVGALLTPTPYWISSPANAPRPVLTLPCTGQRHSHWC